MEALSCLSARHDRVGVVYNSRFSLGVQGDLKVGRGLLRWEDSIPWGGYFPMP